MIRGLLAGAAIAAFLTVSQPVTAADLPRAPIMKAAAVAPMFNWTGFYAGVSAGGGWVDTAWSNAVFGTYSGENDGSGAVAGGTAGWNWQSGSVVVGIEADLSWANLKVAPIFDCVRDCSTEMKWLSTVRGRLGTTFGSPTLLVFVTGGVAFADIEHIVVPVSTISNTETGWTVGGGIEWAIDGQWSAKLEYLHVDFGRQLSCSAGPCDFNNYANYVRADIVRAGFNYRFATGKAPLFGKTPAPVVTKY